MFVLQSGGGVVGGVVGSLVLILLGVVVLAVLARRSVARLRQLLAAESTLPGEVSPGPVQVEGEVVAVDGVDGFETRLIRDLDEDPVATQYRGPGARGFASGSSLPVPQQFVPEFMSEVDAAPFYVADDSGRVLVDGGRAELSLESDAFHETGTTSDEPTSRVEAALATGDTVSVVGEAVPAASYESDSTPLGGALAPIRSLLNGGQRASALGSLDGEEVVLTRTAGLDLVVSDTSDGRSLLRRGLAATFWTLAGVGLIALGVFSLLA